MNKNVERAILAMRQRDDAERAYQKACVLAFPIGSCVAWMHGRHERIGYVVDHGGFGATRLKVRSDVSELEYWIETSRVLTHEDRA